MTAGIVSRAATDVDYLISSQRTYLVLAVEPRVVCFTCGWGQEEEVGQRQEDDLR